MHAPFIPSLFTMATPARVSCFRWTSSIFISLALLRSLHLVTGSRSFDCIYAFGDSLTDTGNALIYQHSINVDAIEGHLPYGHTFFHYPTGRFSDGRLVIDFLAERLKAPHYLRPFLGLNRTRTSLVNFAVGGATALNVNYLNVTFNISVSIAFSLPEQLKRFSRFPIFRDKGAISKALLYIGEIGVNDYNAALLHSFSIDDIIIRFVPDVIKSIQNTLESLIAKGAKYFVVEGSYPVGCTSLYTTQYFINATIDQYGCVKELQKLNQVHDKLLRELVRDLTIKYSPNIYIVFFDQLKAFLEILKHLSFYGFTNTNTTDPCFNSLYSGNFEECQSPSTYVNWDGIHFTEATNRVLLDLFYAKGFVIPYPNFLIS